MVGRARRLPQLSSFLGARRLPPQSPQAPQAPQPTCLRACRYHFQIGSTDALERKLDEAQRELQIPADKHVPVK